MAKREGKDAVWKVKSLIVQLRKFCSLNCFFTIFSLLTVNIDTCLTSVGSFSKVPKLTNDLIRLVKFLVSIPVEPFLMPLCLFSFKFFKTLRYSFGLTVIVIRQGLSIYKFDCLSWKTKYIYVVNETFKTKFSEHE